MYKIHQELLSGIFTEGSMAVDVVHQTQGLGVRACVDGCMFVRMHI